MGETVRCGYSEENVMRYRPNIKQMIERALDNKGYRQVKVWYEPVGRAAEMCGPSGGWKYEACDVDGSFYDGELGYNGNQALIEVGRLEDVHV
jgi:hypothetical protein